MLRWRCWSSLLCNKIVHSGVCACCRTEAYSQFWKSLWWVTSTHCTASTVWLLVRCVGHISNWVLLCEWQCEHTTVHSQNSLCELLIQLHSALHFRWGRWMVQEQFLVFQMELAFFNEKMHCVLCENWKALFFQTSHRWKCLNPD